MHACLHDLPDLLALTLDIRPSGAEQNRLCQEVTSQRRKSGEKSLKRKNEKSGKLCLG